jgi:hypothetical protein
MLADSQANNLMFSLLASLNEEKKLGNTSFQESVLKTRGILMTGGCVERCAHSGPFRDGNRRPFDMRRTKQSTSCMIIASGWLQGFFRPPTSLPPLLPDQSTPAQEIDETKKGTNNVYPSKLQWVPERRLRGG